jgi:hypothetical protein
MQREREWPCVNTSGDVVAKKRLERALSVQSG